MPSTYEPIATLAADGTSLSATFSSVPSSYTDLIIVCSLTAGNTGDAYLRFNGDTGSNYSDTVVRGSGSASSSVRDSNAPGIDIGAISNITGSEVGSVVIHIMNYSSSSTNKTSLIRFSEATNWSTAIVGLWRSTAVISSITLGSRSGNWGLGSTFTLYGIKAA